MKKNINLFVFLVLFRATVAFGYDKQVSGYYITTGNDSIKCIFIIPLSIVSGDPLYSELQLKIGCLDSTGKKKIKLKPSEIKGFVLLTDTLQQIFISKKVFYEPRAFSHDSTLFMRLKIDGYLKMYEYYYENQDMSAAAHTYEKSICIQKGDGESLFSWNKKTLSEYLSEDTQLAKEIQEREWKNKDIQKVVNEYNLWKAGMNSPDDQATGIDTVISNSTDTVIPAFPGGEKAMLRFIARNFRYPADSREKNIQGRVYITFVVDEGGNILNPQILRSLSKDCDEEALRIVRMMPLWTPAMEKNHPVAMTYSLPINFTLR